MADIDIDVRWDQRGLEFIARGRSGHEVRIDGDTRASISPVETLLIAFATCMAADLVDITGRMRLPLASLVVRASGMRNPEPPRRYLSTRLVFEVGGVGDEDAAKLARALDLSREKYCSVLHTLRPDLNMEFELTRSDPETTVVGVA